MSAFRSDTIKTPTIEITINPSLLNHFTQNLSRQKSRIIPEDAITVLLTTILDNSSYPIKAKRTGKREIEISYHLHTFFEPIF